MTEALAYISALALLALFTTAAILGPFLKDPPRDD